MRDARRTQSGTTFYALCWAKQVITWGEVVSLYEYGLELGASGIDEQHNLIYRTTGTSVRSVPFDTFSTCCVGF